MVNLTKDEIRYLAGSNGPDTSELSVLKGYRIQIGTNPVRNFIAKLKLMKRDQRKELFEYSVNFEDALGIKYRLHALQNMHSKEVIDRCWNIIDPRTHLVYPYNKKTRDDLSGYLIKEGIERGYFKKESAS